MVVCVGGRGARAGGGERREGGCVFFYASRVEKMAGRRRPQDRPVGGNALLYPIEPSVKSFSIEANGLYARCRRTASIWAKKCSRHETRPARHRMRHPVRPLAWPLEGLGTHSHTRPGMLYDGNAHLEAENASPLPGWAAKRSQSCDGNSALGASKKRVRAAPSTQPGAPLSPTKDVHRYRRRAKWGGRACGGRKGGEKERGREAGGRQR